MTQPRTRPSMAWLAIGTVAVAGCGLLFAQAEIHAAPPTTKSTKATDSKAPTATKRSTSAIAHATHGDETPLTETQRIVHVLNRLGYGPRPGDIEKVRQIGVNAYIEQQLNPERIKDDGVEAKLADFDVLRATNTELADDYRGTITSAIQARQMMEEMAKKNGEKMEDLPTDPESMRKKMAEKFASMTPEQRAEFMKKNQGKDARRAATVQAAGQLTAAKIIRAVESEKQLQEVLVDFWSNHFNIDIRKGLCRVLKVSDDRDAIRPNILSKFRTLLGASAKSPAMMFYLDNAQSSAPREMQIPPRLAARMAQNPNNKLVQRRRGGINENYAREIMELHTLGVEGGYSQKDVQEVARCLTGWGIRNGEFYFDRNRHDDGEKIVLGRKIPAGGGMADGEIVLDILATHPSTMRYVSSRLCQKLVSDTPPASLVDKCVATWKRTDGDLREVTRTIVTSPEFFSRAAYRQKIKSPFEYAVSSIRALDGEIVLPGNPTLRLAGGGGGQALQNGLAGQISQMGEPLFQCQPPTGYPVDSRKWVSTGALIARLNYSLRLTTTDMPGIDLTDARNLIPAGTSPADAVNKFGETLLHGELTPTTRATVLKEVKASETAKEPIGTRRVAALLLGSPEFQRR